MIGGVKTAASSVAEASEHLSRASEQTARVTQQITNAIQQVAKGTTEQSASLQEIVVTEQKLSKAIEQMASGSQEQAASAEEADRMVKQVSVSVAQVLQNAQAGTEAWRSTAKSAETGARTTYETIEGMKKIKEAMDLVSLRVADLGERSKEIGSIVATIDDISAQTNLLALNAAIEAARAGEQGRGFAVVADEVRKLAERASVATKEIAALISNIQSGVSEAVKAMGRGGQEVEAGYGLAAEAGRALDDILERAQMVGKQVNQISAAAEELNALSGNMVSVIQQINRTIDENAAAAETMAESSSLVSGAIENLGGVAEENSASAEEVSASVEEMSAGVEEDPGLRPVSGRNVRGAGEIRGHIQDGRQLTEGHSPWSSSHDEAPDCHVWCRVGVIRTAESPIATNAEPDVNPPDAQGPCLMEYCVSGEAKCDGSVRVDL